MNKHIKEEIGFEEEKAGKIEVNHAFFGEPKVKKVVDGLREAIEEEIIPPKMIKIQKLKSGFFYKRPVLLTEASYHYCYIAKAFLFTINVVEGDIQRQRVLSFYLKGEEAGQMGEFLAANKVPFELELVIRLGVVANEQKSV